MQWWMHCLESYWIFVKNDLITHLTQYFIFLIFFSLKSKSFFANKSIKIWVWAIAQAAGRLPATSHFASLCNVI